VKRVHATPGTPQKVLQSIKPENEEYLKKEEMKKYQSGVGSLLYLLKHSRPELSNPIRELLKCMNGANYNPMKEV
jgi:hypothetical protein